jgi:NhaP-type Na+/H+ or K+/H+ antiporter
MNLKHVVIITWGGLKGAVSLALALTVAQTTDIDFFTIGSKVRKYHMAQLFNLPLGGHINM